MVEHIYAALPYVYADVLQSQNVTAKIWNRRGLRLREAKCLPMVMPIVSGEVGSQIQVRQDSKIHVCAPPMLPHHRVCVLAPVSSFGLMEVWGLWLLPFRYLTLVDCSFLGLAVMVSLPVTGVQLGWQNIACLSWILLKSSFRTTSTSTLWSWSFAKPEMEICSVHLRNSEEYGCSTMGVDWESERERRRRSWRIQCYTCRGWML